MLVIICFFLDTHTRALCFLWQAAAEGLTRASFGPILDLTAVSFMLAVLMIVSVLYLAGCGGTRVKG